MPKKGKKGSRKKSDLEKEFDEYVPIEGNNIESKKWAIFEIQHFDFPGGDIADYACRSCHHDSQKRHALHELLAWTRTGFP